MRKLLIIFLWISSITAFAQDDLLNDLEGNFEEDKKVIKVSASLGMSYELVLIIDDEKDIGVIVKDILEQDLGLKTEYALNAHEALQIIKQTKPKVIILDIWLENSDIDGIQIEDFLILKKNYKQKVLCRFLKFLQFYLIRKIIPNYLYRFRPEGQFSS